MRFPSVSFGSRDLGLPRVELAAYLLWCVFWHSPQEEQKTMKSKMREKVRPKMGKIDIDYQKLHDAFFKWQTKPKLTIHGDLYYEVREGAGRQHWAFGHGCVTLGQKGSGSRYGAPSPQPLHCPSTPFGWDGIGIRWSSEGDMQIVFLR